jgi:hypothetical protein
MVYAFPPFGILGKVLKKFKDDGAEGIVIVPYWVTRPWFTQWGRLLIAEPLLIEVNTNDVIYLPYRTSRSHPLVGDLKLLVGMLSGDASRQKGFRTGLSRPCYMPDGTLQTNSTRRIGQSGKTFVVKGNVVHPRRMW